MILGIDLGTTNSLIAIQREREAEIIPNALGRRLTPSVVGLNGNGEIIVGEEASQRLSTHPELTQAAFKRYMGTNQVLKLGRRKFRPEELSALVLKSLKADAEAFLGEPVEDVVISVPAYFNDSQRKATKAAGEIANLNVRRLINEPTAAAIAYGLHDEQGESTFLVFDLGGGTFDVSVLELFDGVMQVHASAGDNFLGGEDFTDVIVAHFLQEHRIDPKALNANERASLKRLAENSKIEVSSGRSVAMKLQHRGESCETALTPEIFERISAPLVDRLRTPIERALRDADLRATELDAVVMVGGACRMQLIRQTAGRLFGRLPHATINVDETVALGAAVQAAMLAENQYLDEVVLTDVMPYSLGVGIHNPNSSDPNEMIFSPLIERNSPVPVSRVSDFYPVDKRQKKVEFGIFQGESRYVGGNVKLGEVTIPVKPGHDLNRMDVRFTFDLNGILEVDIQNVSTGVSERQVIEENPGVMTRKEIEAALKELEKLKIHPRDKTENSTVLARGNRLYEEAIGEAREEIAQIILEFETILQRQNPEEIERVRDLVSAALDDFDSDPLG